MYTFLLALLALLLLADIFTTRYVVTHGGTELNPIYAGNPTWWKLFGTHVVVWFAFYWLIDKWPNAFPVLLIGISIYFYVLLHNLSVVHALPTAKENT